MSNGILQQQQLKLLKITILGTDYSWDSRDENINSIRVGAVQTGELSIKVEFNDGRKPQIVMAQPPFVVSEFEESQLVVASADSIAIAKG